MVRELLRQKRAVCALLLLAILYLSALFADFIAPYRYDDEDVLYSWCPPMKVYFFDRENSSFRPYIHGYTFEMNEYYQRVYKEDVFQKYSLKFFVKGYEYKLFGIWNTDIHLFGTERGRFYLLGADLKGRDIFSRLVYGARISLSIGLIGVLISFSIGMIVGGVSGYYGGWIDTVLMRIVEMMMMVPGFYLMLALRASFPPEMSSTQVYLLIVVILSLIGWASIARVIRGMAVSLRENEFVLAAKSFGMNDVVIIIRHILPHTLSYTLVALCLSIPSYIIGEAALSLLGLGIQEPYASWGNMLAAAQGIVQIKLYPWILWPGALILVTTVCFNLLADILRDILDPKRKDFR